MTDYTDLIARLQNDCAEFEDPICGEAADALEAQARRIAELEAALKEVAVCLDGDRTGEDLLFAVRTARAALEKTND